MALDTFASSLVGVDADGNAATPCYTYADSRCAAQVDRLRAVLDEDATQQRTGTRQHTGYLPPRFLWLQETDPDAVARVRRWMSLGEYAYLKLIGTTAAGTSTAAWTGMLDRGRRGRRDELDDLAQFVGDLVGVDDGGAVAAGGEGVRNLEPAAADGQPGRVVQAAPGARTADIEGEDEGGPGLLG